MTEMTHTPTRRTRISSPAPIRSLRQHRHASRIAEARTCYDHLAGRRGVQLRDRLLATGAVEPVDDRDHARTSAPVPTAVDVAPGWA
jgi:hypothetical protein